MTNLQQATMWAIYNRNGERLHQYPASSYEDQARRILRAAQQQHPAAGLHLRRVAE